MSNPTAPASPTRQQLDELDALLQRMLALPVHASSDEARAADRNAATVSPADSANEPPCATSGTNSAWALHYKLAEGPILSGPATPRREVPVLPIQDTPLDMLNDRQSSPEPLRGEPRAADCPAPVAGWFVPLVWCNRVFDGCVALLGPLGHWLQSPTVRTFLGLTGLLCLAAAAVLLLLDRIGWTW